MGGVEAEQAQFWNTSEQYSRTSVLSAVRPFVCGGQNNVESHYPEYTYIYIYICMNNIHNGTTSTTAMNTDRGGHTSNSSFTRKGLYGLFQFLLSCPAIHPSQESASNFGSRPVGSVASIGVATSVTEEVLVTLRR